MNEQGNGQESGYSLDTGMLSCAVVVVALVVVAAVLFPTFARVREMGRHRPPGCQSNMKECAIALQIYWNDHDGHLPSSFLVSHSTEFDKSDFEVFASEVGSHNPLPAHRRTWSEILFSSMKNKDIMFCPSDESDHNAPNAQTSYWWKLAIDKAWYGEQCAKPCRVDDGFLHMADQIVLYERCGFHSGAKRGLRNDVQIMAVYLDTHVKTVTITNSLPANGKRWVTSPSALGEPAYFNYDNKTNTRIKDPNTLANHVDPARFSDSL